MSKGLIAPSKNCDGLMDCLKAEINRLAQGRGQPASHSTACRLADPLPIALDRPAPALSQFDDAQAKTRCGASSGTPIPTATFFSAAGRIHLVLRPAEETRAERWYGAHPLSCRIASLLRRKSGVTGQPAALHELPNEHHRNNFAKSRKYTKVWHRPHIAETACRISQSNRCNDHQARHSHKMDYNDKAPPYDNIWGRWTPASPLLPSPSGLPHRLGMLTTTLVNRFGLLENELNPRLFIDRRRH